MYTNNPNFFQILDISYSADLHQIKKAFKRQAILFHPDKNPSKLASERYAQIYIAYETLSDPKKRLRYQAILLNRQQRSKKTLPRASNKQKINTASEKVIHSQKRYRPNSSTASTVSSIIDLKKLISPFISTLLKQAPKTATAAALIFLLTFGNYSKNKYLQPIDGSIDFEHEEKYLNEQARSQYLDFRNRQGYSLVNRLQLRTHPDLKANVIENLVQYETINIIDRSNNPNWIKVELETGETGYLWESYVGYGKGDIARKFDCNKYPTPRPKDKSVFFQETIGERDIELKNNESSDAIVRIYDNNVHLILSIYLYPNSSIVVKGFSNKSLRFNISHGAVYNASCGRFSFPNGRDVVYWSK